VPIETGERIIAELRERLPGYAVPRFVVELPSEPSKTILA
jgi:L-lysine 2,3-aminomutase